MDLSRIPDYVRIVRDVFGNFGIDRHVSFRREPSRFGTVPPETDSVRSRIYGPANRQRVERIATDESVRYPVETVVFLFPEIDLHFWQESIHKRIYLRYMESRRCSHHHMALVPGQKHLAVHGRKRAQLGEILEIHSRRRRQRGKNIIKWTSRTFLGIIPVRSLAGMAKAERVVRHFQCIANGKSIPLKMVAVFLFIEPHGGLTRGSIIRSSEVRIAPGLRDRFIEHTHASGILGVHTHHVTAIEQSRQMQGNIQRILADNQAVFRIDYEMVFYARRIYHLQIDPRRIRHPLGIGAVNTNGIGRSSTGSQFDNVRPFKIIIISEITVEVSQNGFIALRDPGNIPVLVILQG